MHPAHVPDARCGALSVSEIEALGFRSLRYVLYPKIEVTAAMAAERPALERYVGRKLTVIAWLWARTVKSPNPAFAHVDVPLASTFMLSTKKGKEAYVEPVIEDGGYRFTVKDGAPEAGVSKAGVTDTGASEAGIPEAGIPRNDAPESGVPEDGVPGNAGIPTVADRRSGAEGSSKGDAGETPAVVERAGSGQDRPEVRTGRNVRISAPEVVGGHRVQAEMITMQLQQFPLSARMSEDPS